MTPKRKRIASAFRIDNGRGFRLKDVDPSRTPGVSSKRQASRELRAGIERLSALQERLYAQDRWAILLVFQGMDAAGKDSAIKHVMTGVNPQGCEVTSFKEPSIEDLNHDFLWRVGRRLPERGKIGIFNRSHYEEVLVVRVHPDLLLRERVPKELLSKKIWEQRFEDIRAWEHYLGRNGVLVRKFFLHMSRDEQRKRFLKRLDQPEKRWKFSLHDVTERDHWNAYMDAYEDAIRKTSTPEAPWYVVPSDHKWFTRLVVADAVVEALESVAPSFPKPDPESAGELKAARAELERARPGTKGRG